MFTRPNRQAGAAGIVLFLLMAAALAAFIFMGDTIRGMIGLAPTPDDPGSSPARAVAPDPDFEPRMPAVEPDLPDDERLAFGTNANIDGGQEQTDLPAEESGGKPDDPEAKQLLEKQDVAYRNFQWDEVHDLRRRIIELDSGDNLRAAARERSRSARQLSELMNELDSAKFGLSRNIETHPSLVTIVNSIGNEVEVVPIDSMRDKNVIETDNPVGYLQKALASGRDVPVMTTSRIPTEYTSDKVVRVDPADTSALIAQRRSEFDRKLRRMKNSAAWQDALALFDAARFAYGNRIDNQVTALLDRALLLNPKLVQAVKEDEAQPYFEKMVRHLEDGNKTSAAGFLNSLKKNFEDTAIYAQARAYYDGNAKAALAAAEAAKREIEQARKREFEERRKLAREAKNKEALARLDETEETIEQQEEQEREDRAAVSGDEAQADEYYDKGYDFYAQAIDAGNTSKRDTLYGEAIGWFTKARDLYSKLVEANPDDGDLMSKLVRCNQLRYGSIKQKRSGGF